MKDYSTLSLPHTPWTVDRLPRLFVGIAPHSPAPLRFVVWLRCDRCHAGFFAAAPLLIPQVCPACLAGRLRRVGAWDLQAEAWPGSEVERLSVLYHDACEQLQDVLEQYQALRGESARLKADNAQLVNENRRLAMQFLGFGRLPGPGRLAMTSDVVDRLLRDLIVKVHPDRWAQGQPAEALAHEVTVVLNELRQRLGEGQV